MAAASASAPPARLHTLASNAANGASDAAALALGSVLPGADGSVSFKDVLIATSFATRVVTLFVTCARLAGDGAVGRLAWQLTPQPLHFAPCDPLPSVAQSQTMLPAWRVGVGLAEPGMSHSPRNCDELLPPPRELTGVAAACSVAPVQSAGSRSGSRNGSTLYLSGAAAEAQLLTAGDTAQSSSGSSHSLGVATFNSLTLTGLQGSIYPLQLTCTLGGVAIPPSPMMFAVGLAGCAAGSKPEGVFCAKCPEGTFSLGGARDTDCHACPTAGALCSAGIITLLPGFYRPLSERCAPITASSVLLPCFNEIACTLNASTLASGSPASAVHKCFVDSLPVPEYGCSAGYSQDGAFCGVCDEPAGYAMFGTACGRCWPTAAGRSLVAALFLLLIIALFGSAWLGWVDPDADAAGKATADGSKAAVSATKAAAATPSSRTASIALRLLLTHVQFLGAMQAFRSASLEQFKAITGWASTVSASPFSLGPVQCVLRLPYIARFLAIVTLPLTAPLLLAVAYALVAALRSVRRFGTSGAAAGWRVAMRAWLIVGKHMSTAVAVMSLAYMPIVTTALTALDCTDTAIDGVRYLQADLSVPCYTGQHAVAQGIAFIVLALVGLGFPVLLVTRLWRAGPVQLRRPGFRAAWAGLYEGYRGLDWVPGPLQAVTRGRSSVPLCCLLGCCCWRRSRALSVTPGHAALQRAAASHGLSAWRLCVTALPASPHVLWWEAVILLRKAGIVLIATLATSASLQLSALGLMALGALLAQLRFTPYAEKDFNGMEALGLVAIIMTALLSGVSAATTSSPKVPTVDMGQQVATVLMLVVNGAVLTLMLARWLRLQGRCALGAARGMGSRRSSSRATQSKDPLAIDSALVAPSDALPQRTAPPRQRAEVALNPQRVSFAAVGARRASAAATARHGNGSAAVNVAITGLAGPDDLAGEFGTTGIGDAPIAEVVAWNPLHRPSS